MVRPGGRVTSPVVGFGSGKFGTPCERRQRAKARRLWICCWVSAGAGGPLPTPACSKAVVQAATA